jgi:hypothetical protein
MHFAGPYNAPVPGNYAVNVTAGNLNKQSTHEDEN